MIYIVVATKNSQVKGKFHFSLLQYHFQIPIKAPQTRWEQFAQRKGIQTNRDKDKKVFDEETGTWVPRYGYKSAQHKKDQNWLIEIPDQKDPFNDYFGERDDAKKESVAKNQLQHLKNVKRHLKEVGKNGYQRSYSNQDFGKGSNAIPLGVAQDPKNNTKSDLGYKLHHAKEATASAGKYQKMLKGEKTPKLGIKRKVRV